jgi:hypothetical protein
VWESEDLPERMILSPQKLLKREQSINTGDQALHSLKHMPNL